MTTAPETPFALPALPGAKAQPRPPITAPNTREFTLDSPEAWRLFRPDPTLLPHFPRLRHNPVARDEG